MASFDPDRPYRIINRKSGKALSAAGTTDGSRAILHEFVNGLDQIWYVVDAGDGFFRLENRHSGKLLSTENGGSASGTIVHVWQDLATLPDQYWTIDEVGPGFVKIANRTGGRVVSCLGGGTANDTALNLQDYEGGAPDREWNIEPVPAYDGRISYRIVNRKSNTDLSVYRAGTANGSRAILFHPADAEDQRWHIVDVGNGFHKLVNNHSGRVLSTANGEAINGTVLHLWDDLATLYDQHWAITPVGDGLVKITNRLCGRAVSCLNQGEGDDTTIHLWDYLGGYPDQDWRLVPVTEHVDIDADRTIAEVSPHMAGVCLEDVNHEVYGGIDSQMIFGESFQEPPPYDPDAIYRIINKQSGTALSVRRRAMDNGALAIIWDFVGAPDQFWRIVDIGEGFHKIVNVHSGKALSTLNGGSANGTPVHQWDYLGTFRDQHWAICPDDASVRIMSRTSRRVLACLDRGKVNNTRVELHDYALRNDVTWVITQVQPITQPQVSGMWRAFSKGSATGSYALDSVPPRVTGWRSQRITHAGGSGEVGIENRSLNRWGMNIQAGKAYEGYIYVRTSALTTVYVAFESASGGSVYAESSFEAVGPDWMRYDFTLTPGTDDPRGGFAIKLKAPGSIDVCYAFVQPGGWGRFKGLPVRKDIALRLVAQGNRLMRFGGSTVSLSQNYRWKNMRGARDSRTFTGGFFYTYGSNGWGIFEFLNLAEAMDVVGVPTISIDESPEDAVHLIDYLNGPISTQWGQQRADDGHPAPYRVKYLQLGNEQTVNHEYGSKFETLARKLWARDPEIILIVGDREPEALVQVGDGTSPPIYDLAWQQSILELAKENRREVWFDCHVWTDDVDLGVPGEQRYDAKVLKQVALLDLVYRQLDTLCPGATFKLVVFELNANSHDMHRALGNALAINAMQRLGNKIRMVASANALQPDEQNDNVWDQGLLFFDSRRTWPQPPYYVNQMKAHSYLPRVVQAKVSGRESVTFDVTAMRSDDGKTLDLHVVNTIDVARKYTFNLHGFAPI